MKAKTLVTAVILILTATFGLAQESMTAKESLDYFTGTWVSEYEYPGMGTVREENTYTRTDDENMLKLNVAVFSGGKQIDTGEGWIKYLPEEDIVIAEVSSEAMNEVYSNREISRIGNVVWLEGHGGKMMPHFRVKMIVTSEDSFDWNMYLPKDGDWSEAMTVTYNRKK